MAELSYAESIATRTEDRPEERAELSNALDVADVALVDAAANVTHPTIIELEGHDDGQEEGWSSLPDRLARFRAASSQFEAAVQAALEFNGKLVYRAVFEKFGSDALRDGLSRRGVGDEEINRIIAGFESNAGQGEVD